MPFARQDRRPGGFGPGQGRQGQGRQGQRRGDAAVAAAGVKAAAEEVSAIKDVICLLRNTPRRVPIRPGLKRSHARNCRPTTNPSFCRANPWPNTKTARLKRAALAPVLRLPRLNRQRCLRKRNIETMREPSAEAAEHAEQDRTASEGRRLAGAWKTGGLGRPAAAAMPARSPCPIPRPSPNIRRFLRSRRAPFTKAPPCRIPLPILRDRRTLR